LQCARLCRAVTPRGDTYEEALENIQDAIHLHIEDIIESGEVIEKINSFSLVALEVTA
jgi:predicted RNase H-like HicB family nuclease